MESATEDSCCTGEEDRHHQGPESHHWPRLEGLAPEAGKHSFQKTYHKWCQDAKGLADNPGKFIEGKPKEFCEDAVPCFGT